MSETTLLIVFIAVTSVAVVLQTLILAGLYFSVRKMMERTQSLQQKMNDQALPLVAKVRSFVDESQAGKLDSALTEIVDIARTQAERAGELATRTMGRVDQTAERVQGIVNSPLRRVSGLMEGVAAALAHLVGSRLERRPSAPAAPKAKGEEAAAGEMFI
jgi:hypothetical protein